MAYSLDTKVGDILKDTHAVEILEKHVPGISKNPMLGLAKGMTLKSILAMPLIVDDRVIGVMEVLDKISASSFGMQDMELLGIFARQRASHCEQLLELLFDRR